VIQVLVTTANEVSRGAGRIRGHARVVAVRTRRAK
jgi:hypothetical protein